MNLEILNWLIDALGVSGISWLCFYKCIIEVVFRLVGVV